MIPFWVRITTGATTTSLRIGAASIIQRANVARISGETLRGKRYSHRLHSGWVWNVVIYPHMLNYTVSVMRSIFTADRIEFNPSSLGTSPTTGWFDVHLDGGTEAFEQITGANEGLNVYNFNFVSDSIESGV